jgi:NAD(P)-dependent dehydrogenase (short-subunit alcohol dehydrogenase family)
MMRFAGKTILVTGGSSGIGLAVASRIVSEGGKVILTGRDKANLEAAVQGLGTMASGMVSDAASLPAIDELLAFIRREAGSLDGIFANAGTVIFEPVQTVTEEHFDRLMNLNVKGVFFTLQKTIPLLVDGASIVVNASVAGTTSTPISAVYSATKAAVRSMARSFAVSLVDRNIRVNAVSPGPALA